MKERLQLSFRHLRFVFHDRNFSLCVTMKIEANVRLK